jgi:hypothetical protein
MLITKVSFSGHDKFDCKVDWITKGLQAYEQNNKIFLQTNIRNSIKQLGLGINMIKSLSHWMSVLGLINNDSLSLLGQIILDKDPYLENLDTFWILHWNLVKNIKRNTLYNLFFNKYYPYKFSKKDILNYVISWMDKNNVSLSHNTLNSDIDVFLKMYAKSNKDNTDMNLLSDLNIITRLTNSEYSLNINSTAKISDEVFLYILCDCFDMKNSSNTKSISMDDIQKGVLSIQKSLCMSENMLYSKIYKLQELTDNRLSYSEASGIKQIYINSSIDSSELFSKIYK